MEENRFPWIRYPQLGCCGLSCRLCPRFHSREDNRCGGCKEPLHMEGGCPILNCAVKRKGVEFCWECDAAVGCGRWTSHLKFGRDFDSYKCCQTEEADVSFIRSFGAAKFEVAQKERQALLEELLRDYDEGHSRSYYCIAATVMEPGELRGALDRAGRETADLDKKGKSKALHKILNDIAKRRGYLLKLRK